MRSRAAWLFLCTYVLGCDRPCGATPTDGGCEAKRCKKTDTTLKICEGQGGAGWGCDFETCENHCKNTVLGEACSHFAFQAGDNDCYLFDECILEPNTDYTTYALARSCTIPLEEGGCPEFSCPIDGSTPACTGCDAETCKGLCEAGIDGEACTVFAHNAGTGDCYVFTSCSGEGLEANPDFTAYANTPKCEFYDPFADTTEIVSLDVEWALTKEACRDGQCIWGTLATDALLASCPACDLVMIGGGGMRGDNLPAGVNGTDKILRTQHMYYVNKYSDDLQYASYPGTAVLQSIIAGVDNRGSGDFKQLSSNLRVAFDGTDGSSIRVQYREKDAGCNSWQDFDTGRNYTVGSTWYLLNKADSDLSAVVTGGTTQLVENYASLVNSVLPSVAIRYRGHADGACADSISTKDAFTNDCRFALRNDGDTADELNAGCNEIHILGSTRVHGSLLPQSKYNSDCSPDKVEESPDSCFGGIARRAALMNEIRTRFPGRTISVDGGDHYFGGTFYYLFKGSASQELFNMLNYDAVGVHYADFHGTAGVVDVPAAYLSGLDMPVLCSNCDFEDVGLGPQLRRWHVVTAGGKKVGILSVMPADAKDKTKLPPHFVVNPFILSGTDLTFATLVNVQVAVAELKAAHPDCETLIAVSSATGLEVDVLLEAIPELAFVLENNDDEDWTFTSRTVTTLDKARVVTRGSLARRGKHLGHIVLELNDDGSLRFGSGMGLSLDGSVGLEADVWTRNKELYDIVLVEQGVVVGQSSAVIEHTADGFDAKVCRMQDCPAGRFVADAYRDICESADTVGADCIGLVNAGGVRADLPKGDVTRNDLLGVVPFQETLKVVRLDGSVLINVLRHAATQVGSGGFLHASGLRYAFATSEAEENPDEEAWAAVREGGKSSYKWARLVSAEFQSQDGTWSPVLQGPDDKYVVAVPAFVLNGGDDFPFDVPGVELIEVYGTVRDSAALEDFVKTGAVDLADGNPSQPTLAELAAACNDNVNTEGYNFKGAGGAGCLVVISSMEPEMILEGICAPGQYLENGAYCAPCERGTFSRGGKIVECSPCGEGYFQDEEGADDCKPCLSGSWREDSDDAWECVSCEPGFHRPEGIDGCRPCEAGHFMAESGASRCKPCPVGFFVDENGATSCTECPVGKETRLLGGMSEDCVCKSGSYSFEDDGVGACKSCGDGLVCDGGYAHPIVLEGFSSTPLISGVLNTTSTAIDVFNVESVYRCFEEGACPGGEPNLCGEGYDPDEVACGACLYGYYRSGTSCEECQGMLSHAVVPLFALFVPMALLVVHKMANSIVTGRATSILAATAAMSGSLTAVQTMSIFNNLPQIKLPNIVIGLFDFFEIFVFNIEFLQYDCLAPLGVTTRYFVRTIVPIICIASLGGMWAITQFLPSQFRKYRMDGNLTFNTSGMLLQILFISTSMAVFLPFVCYDHPTDGESSIVAFNSILCGEDPRHGSLQAIAITALLLFPIPFFAAACMMTYAAAERTRTDPAFILRWKFLFVRFRPTLYYWSIPFLMRNFGFGITPVIARGNTLLSLVLMLVIAVLALVAQCIMMPWHVNIVNVLDIVLLTTVVAISGTSISLIPSDLIDEHAAGVVVSVLVLVQTLFIGIVIGSTIYQSVKHKGKEYRTEENRDWARNLAHDIQMIGKALAASDLLEQKDCFLSLSDYDLKKISSSVQLLALLYELPAQNMLTDVKQGRISSGLQSKVLTPSPTNKATKLEESCDTATTPTLLLSGTEAPQEKKPCVDV